MRWQIQRTAYLKERSAFHCLSSLFDRTNYYGVSTIKCWVEKTSINAMQPPKNLHASDMVILESRLLLGHQHGNYGHYALGYCTAHLSTTEHWQLSARSNSTFLHGIDIDFRNDRNQTPDCEFAIPMRIENLRPVRKAHPSLRFIFFRATSPA
jgi:hypothetical protein